ncbi:S53 family peptidase [Gandjariella thermophila]|uniref:Pseudomonapepsin n=1 Tax=Gandjariella thermophila TaxID=1931992 RepID=A0A4D4JFP6_9PSEU|nr:S53 family peptidase [Gandjariella thermophila]GDY33820.1 pseudomonapepsin [Gandjariella thermophila]
MKLSLRASVTTVAAIPLLIAGGVAAGAQPQAPLVPLAASVAPGLDLATRTGPESTVRPMSVAVSLKLRNQSELDALLGRITDPASADYGHYLTPEEFRDRFAPTAQQADVVAGYLRAHGLTASTSANRQVVDATGTVAQIEAAFGTTLSRWHDRAANRDFTANDTAVSLPGDVAGLVAGVAGLNDHYPRHHSHVRPNAPRVGSGPAGGYTPTELRGAYTVDRLLKSGVDGSGQKIGLMEFAAFEQKNITAYDQFYRTGSPAPQVRPVDGGSTTLGDAQVEVELDIEVAHAIAPKATTVVYEAPNSDAGEIDMWNAMVADNVPVVSSSWGLCELDRTQANIRAVDQVAKQAAAQGMTVLSAAGDSGAYDCERDGTNNAKKLAVDFPASDPYVTSVGGTTLTLGPNSSYGTETVWNEGGGWAGGGGYSSAFARPAWQTGSGVHATNKRQTPDVSAAAAGGEYSVYSQGRWGTVGGTSAATPLWAAYLALYDQKAASAGRPRLGSANPALYRVGGSGDRGAAFHDVLTGNNRHYPATPGYDLASGWGSPNADALTAALLRG